MIIKKNEKEDLVVKQTEEICKENLRPDQISAEIIENNPVGSSDKRGKDKLTNITKNDDNKKLSDNEEIIITNMMNTISNNKMMLLIAMYSIAAVIWGISVDSNNSNTILVISMLVIIPLQVIYDQITNEHIRFQAILTKYGKSFYFKNFENLINNTWKMKKGKNIFKIPAIHINIISVFILCINTINNCECDGEVVQCVLQDIVILIVGLIIVVASFVICKDSMNGMIKLENRIKEIEKNEDSFKTEYLYSKDNFRGQIGDDKEKKQIHIQESSYSIGPI